MRICLVTMELDPFSGGGFGATVRALADLLAPSNEVTVVTTSPTESEFAALLAGDDPALNDRVRYIGVDTALETSGDATPEQKVAACVLQTVVGAYMDGGPDVVISADFLGLAAFLISARSGGHPLLRNTRFLVRTAGTEELCALHNHTMQSNARSGVVNALERHCLRDADLIWTQSAETFAVYERYYGSDKLAAHAVLPTPEIPAPLVPRQSRALDDPLRFLYLGRLERRKGTLDVVDGFTRVADSGWSLSLAGSDTATAPGRHSVAATIEAIGDQRVRLLGTVPRLQLPSLFAEHDVYVAPSTWETWGHGPCEAVRAGLPALVTPTGGFPIIVGNGQFGWVCDGTGPDALAEGLRQVLADRKRAVELRSDPALPEHIERLANPSALLSAIEDLGRRPARRRRRASQPLVTTVVPYCMSSPWIGETLASLRAQSYQPLEIVVVNDGNYAAADEDLYDAADAHGAVVISTPSRGLCAARNAGVRHSAGDHVAFLDVNQVASSEWIARLVHVIETEPELGYVSSWLSILGEDGRPIADAQGAPPFPLGNDHPIVDELNIAGGPAALIPRRQFVRDGMWFSEAISRLGHWEYYRALRETGRRGRIIPERLVVHRVRSEELRGQHDARRHDSAGELAASLMMRRTRWTAPKTNTSDT